MVRCKYPFNLVAVSVSIALLGQSTVFAQENAIINDDEQDYLLEEIVVTADRTERNLQDVPVAVTALSSAQIETQGIQRLDDIAASVPGLIIRENTGLSNGAAIYLRGIGEDDSRIGADPAVGIYIDDQYYGRALGGLLDIVEVERVEVLRGPQGTLYGRNSNGGAVKVYTKKPSGDTEISANLRAGSFGLLEAGARISGSLSENSYGQIAFSHRERDGYYSGPGVDDGELGEADKDFFMLNYGLITESDWSIDFKLDYTQDDSDPNFTSPTDAFFDLPSGEIVPEGFGNPAITAANLLSETDIFGVTLNIAGDVAGYDFKSITGYRKTENELLTAIRFFYTQDVEYETFSQEFQLSDGDGEGIDWVTGLYFYEEDSSQDTFFLFAPTSLAIDTSSVALFGQVQIPFGDAWGLTLGGRLTSEEKEATGTALSFGGTVETLNGEEVDDTQFDYRIALDYQATDDVLLYGSVTTGSKAFGWSNDDFGFVDTEEVTTLEAGVRSELAGGAVRLNATAYINYYDDLQLNGTTATAAFTRFNADEVETSGLEVELSWAASENLRFDAALGFQSGDYEQLDPSVIGAFVADTVEEAENRDLKNLPDTTARIAMTYDLSFASGDLRIYGDYNYSSDFFTLLANNPEGLRDDTGLFNARVAWSAPGSRWTIALWGRNLSDEEYVSAAVGPTQIPGAPRTYGVEFGFGF